MYHSSLEMHVPCHWMGSFASAMLQFAALFTPSIDCSRFHVKSAGRGRHTKDFWMKKEYKNKKTHTHIHSKVKERVSKLWVLCELVDLKRQILRRWSCLVVCSSGCLKWCWWCCKEMYGGLNKTWGDGEETVISGKKTRKLVLHLY